MANKGAVTKILAVAGTVLVWLPIAAPLLLSLAFFGQTGMFRVDWLMPAELFPLALAGGLLLLWAAWRARSQRRLIGGGLGIAVVLLFGGQALAVVTGLASGATGPESGWLAVVFATLAVYTGAVVAMGVGGGLLVRHLFRPTGGGATAA
jgi:hypothetical protein